MHEMLRPHEQNNLWEASVLPKELAALGYSAMYVRNNGPEHLDHISSLHTFGVILSHNLLYKLLTRNYSNGQCFEIVTLYQEP